MSAFFGNNAGAFGGRLGFDNTFSQVHPHFGGQLNNNRRFGPNNGNISIDAAYIDDFEDDNQWNNINQFGGINQWPNRFGNQFGGFGRFGGNNQWNNNGFNNGFNNLNRHILANEIDRGLNRNRSFDDFDLPRHHIGNFNNPNQFGRRSFDDLDLLRFQNRRNRFNFDGENDFYTGGLNDVVDEFDLQKLIDQSRFNNRFGFSNGLNGFNNEFNNLNNFTGINGINARDFEVEDILRAQQGGALLNAPYIHPEDIELLRALPLRNRLGFQNQNRRFSKNGFNNFNNNIDDLEILRQLRRRNNGFNNFNNNIDDLELLRQLRRRNNNWNTIDEQDVLRQLRRNQWQQGRGFNNIIDFDDECDDIGQSNTMNNFNTTRRFGRGNNNFNNTNQSRLLNEVERKLIQLNRASRIAKTLGASVIRVADIIDETVEDAADCVDEAIRRRGSFANWQ
ncbi:hypothetical protein HDV00_000245 [Rhizophlyctis rosea]|nr:hypothetical protein HDV00_000245 [Rhizophlyctis rosea]